MFIAKHPLSSGLAPPPTYDFSVFVQCQHCKLPATTRWSRKNREKNDAIYIEKTLLDLEGMYGQTESGRRI